jgi:hypothetical protein
MKTESPPSYRENQHRILLALFLAASILVVYWNVQGFDFIDYDDNIYLFENPHLQTSLTWKTLKWAFLNHETGHWHPLTWLSHIFDWRLFGANAGGHHWTSLVLHILNTILLFTFLDRATGSLSRSAFVAALFALHPLNVESVAWISERKNVLSTFFWLLTLWAYLHYLGRRNLSRYLWVVLFFALGLMAKPMLITLPVTLLLLDYWPLGRMFDSRTPQRTDVLPGDCGVYSPFGHTGLWGLILEKSPLFVLSGLSALMTLRAAEEGGAVKSLDMFPMTLRVANALVSYGQYVRKMFWPHDLTFFYPYGPGPSGAAIMPAVVFFLGATILAVRVRHRYPYVWVGWLWYVITLVPVIGLIQVGFQSMADRYAYIPLVGLFIIIAWGAAGAISRRNLSRSVTVPCAVLAVAVLMGLSWGQVQTWRDSETAALRSLKVNGDNPIAHNILGNVYLDRQRMELAISHYREALRLKPDYATAYNNLGIALMNRGEWGAAEANYRRALQYQPDLAKAYNNMGVALARQGRLEEAIAQFRQAIRIKPEYEGAKHNLAVALSNPKSGVSP